MKLYQFRRNKWGYYEIYPVEAMKCSDTKYSVLGYYKPVHETYLDPEPDLSKSSTKRLFTTEDKARSFLHKTLLQINNQNRLSLHKSEAALERFRVSQL